MTKKEHIEYWSSQVKDDFDCALVLNKAKHYSQSLFWAHLALEKMIKAFWIYKNDSNTPPLVHNLVRLIVQTNEIFSDDDLLFFNEMNVFQIKGRYPNYAEKLEETISGEICDNYLLKTQKHAIMLTREDAINQSIIFVDLCKKSGLEIQKAFIFGSYAKNKFSEFSDIDLALVSNQFTTNSITNNKMTSIINIRFPEIEVHHFNAAYFEKGDSFISEITSNGIEIKN